MSLRVKCPRCGKLLTARQGDSSVDCNCHLYCPNGTKPNDCTITAVSGDITLNWPRGVHGGVVDESDDVHRVTHYCSVHAYYFSKSAIAVPVDWSMLSRRAKPERRYFGEGVQ